jgi:Glycosyl transferase family 11
VATLGHGRTALPGPSTFVLALQGGLGNQLFQYAAARALAGQVGTEPVFDLRLLAHDPKRRLTLNALGVRARYVDSSRLPRPGRVRRWLARAGLRTGSLRRYPFDAPLFEESDSAGCWDARVATIRPPAVLRGYFQSERYFASIAGTLRRELVPLRAPCPTFLRLQAAIRDAGPASASLHVRRGDYANDPKVLAFHGVLGTDYYGPALALLDAQVPGARLFVFTDDTEAAAALLLPDVEATFVSGRGLSDVDELALMSQCRHHVIANSSFSWWGAWLGSPEGLTIAPRRWFAQPSEAAIRDRFPEHWHVVG